MGLRGPPPGSGGREKGTPKTGGRQKGTPNKMTVEVKDAIAEAAAKLGGTNRIVEWAKEDVQNERVFWSSMYVRLLPLIIGSDPKNPFKAILSTMTPQEAAQAYADTLRS